MVDEAKSSEPVSSLNKAFMVQHPADVARRMKAIPADLAVETLRREPIEVVARILERLAPGAADAIIVQFGPVDGATLLVEMATSVAIAMLNRLDEERCDALLSSMDEATAREYQTLLSYPTDTAGHVMDTHIVAFSENLTVAEAVAQIKAQGVKKLRKLYLLADDMQLRSFVEIQDIVLAESTTKLADIAVPVTLFVHDLDPKDEVIDLVRNSRIGQVPVVDLNHHLIGTIEGYSLIEAVRDDLSANMQTMVGVSKDERALSSSWFSVKKRLPWLQINLLTAFLAAAVVGMFEDTISQFTALAILLPIAAGQSGNTGAQALAVTMRGLTLREITVRNWRQIAVKEGVAALINGVAIAITCGAGVYLWSQSTGLALIIALAMVSSMIIAAVAGALVPIILKRLGQDPALSSSIILTTVTDIAGFMSFLGIASMLSGMLEAG